MSRAGRRAAAALARAGLAVVPTGLRHAVEERFFGAVFHATRVTNDAYGWRPDGQRDRPDGHERGEE